jgi:type III restriction enzyme
MLKEGWDVTNLYTIVPLRAANASVLVEQTIGRGLRLPFNGERTGVEKVDKLTVVAHDNFSKIIAAAQDPNSILTKLKFVEIEESELNNKVEVVTVQNTFNQNIQKEQEEVNKIQDTTKKQKQQNIVDAKKILVDIIPTFNSNSQVKKVDDLMKPEIKQKVIDAVQKELSSGQGNLFGVQILEEAIGIYENFVSDYKNNIIEIPRMDLVLGATTASFDDFDLDTKDFNYEQLNDEIVRIGLKDKSYDTIQVQSGVNFGSPVKLLISEIINYSEVDYDENADLLHKLARQVIIELEHNKKTEDDIRKIVFQWRSLIANKVYKQMMAHFKLNEPDYIKPNVKPFTKIEEWNFTTLKNEGQKDYRDESFPAVQVPKYVFRGFEKSCHFEYKFDSRTEQTFSFILENDNVVLKWLRPAQNQFRLWWNNNSKLYLPDFIAETEDCIYMIETKASNELMTSEVQEKAKSAVKYCKYATEFTAENNGKPWKYALIPHDKVSKNNSFKGLIIQYIINQ